MEKRKIQCLLLYKYSLDSTKKKKLSVKLGRYLGNEYSTFAISTATYCYHCRFPAKSLFPSKIDASKKQSLKDFPHPENFFSLKNKDLFCSGIVTGIRCVHIHLPPIANYNFPCLPVLVHSSWLM